MGIPVLILGESGSGKSTALRNFGEEEIGILNVASKPLPFRKNLKCVNNATYSTISKALSNPKLKAYAIDDSQYLMAFEEFDRAKETGYGKFTDMALNFSGLVRYCINSLPPDVVVYFLHHTETTLTLEGLFSIVLLCRTDGQRHWFETQSDGYTTAKSPLDMFPKEIDNDLKAVDTTIREYWGIA